MQPRSYVVAQPGTIQNVQPQVVRMQGAPISTGLQRQHTPNGSVQQQMVPMQGGMQVMVTDNPEAMMNQILQSFGAMGLGGMFGAMGPLMTGNPFESFFNFSDLHKQLNKAGEEGTFVFQAQMTSIEIGPDGKPIVQNYFQNNLGQHMNGHTISEKQQGYKNTAGVNRIAEERMLNDMGRKIVREKRNGQVEQTHHYYNIDEQQSRAFDDRWEQVNRQNKFIENHGRYLGYANSGPAMIQMGPTTTYQVPRQQALTGPTMPQPQLGSFITQPTSTIPTRTAQGFNQPYTQPTQPQQSYVQPTQTGGYVSTTQPINAQSTSSQQPVFSSKLAQNNFFNRQQPQQPPK